MTNNDDILKKLDHKDGMTVPEGYFKSFVERMEAELPERPELSAAAQTYVPRTWWQRLRPYVYMAAMFAGVWCMLKMFTMLTSTSPQPLESNPVIAEAFSNDTFVNDYVIPDVDQWDLYDDIMDEGIMPDSLLEEVTAADSIPVESIK